MSIAELGHTGLWVYSPPKTKDFCTRLLGLQVTDEDERLGIVFLGACPEAEYHEFALQTGRTAALGDKQQHQISWRVQSLDEILTAAPAATAHIPSRRLGRPSAKIRTRTQQ